MSSEDQPQDGAVAVVQPQEPIPPPTAPAAMSTANKKRPRLDLNVEGGRERKRGKTMFGILVGTLNKAKTEDKERNASEAAKKRQLTEQRLLNKLRKETDSVRRGEEARKDKTIANRKEEDLQLKDSIYKLRRTRLPLLSNFLLTSDNISSDPSCLSKPILTLLPRSNPPPLYYLPAILTSAQEDFLSRRKTEVQESIAKEWSEFRAERTAGIEEIKQLRQRVLEEEARKKAEQQAAAEADVDMDADADAAVDAANDKSIDRDREGDREQNAHDPEMDIDVGNTNGNGVANKENESAPIQGDDDDAVEY